MILKRRPLRFFLFSIFSLMITPSLASANDSCISHYFGFKIFRNSELHPEFTRNLSKIGRSPFEFGATLGEHYSQEHLQEILVRRQDTVSAMRRILTSASVQKPVAVSFSRDGRSHHLRLTEVIWIEDRDGTVLLNAILKKTGQRMIFSLASITDVISVGRRGTGEHVRNYSPTGIIFTEHNGQEAQVAVKLITPNTFQTGTPDPRSYLVQAKSEDFMINKYP